RGGGGRAGPGGRGGGGVRIGPGPGPGGRGPGPRGGGGGFLAGGGGATTGFGKRLGARGPGTARGNGPWRWRRWWSWRYATGRRRAGGDLFPDPVIALPLELEGQLLSAGLHDVAVQGHVAGVRLHVLPEALVVRA